MNIYTYLRIKQAGMLDSIKAQAGNLAGKAGDAFNNVVKPTVVNAANKANDFYQEKMEPTVSNAINTANDFYQDKVAPTVNSAVDAAGNAIADGRKWVVEKTPEYKALQGELDATQKKLKRKVDQAKNIISKGADRYNKRLAEQEKVYNDFVGQTVKYRDDSDALFTDMLQNAVETKADRINKDIGLNQFYGLGIGAGLGSLGTWGLRKAYGQDYFKNMAKDKNNKWYKRMLGNTVENLGGVGAGLGFAGGSLYSYNKYKPKIENMRKAQEAMEKRFKEIGDKKLSLAEQAALKRQMFDVFKDI